MEEKEELIQTEDVVKDEPVAPPTEELAFDYNDPDYKRRKKKASIISVCVVVTLIVLFAIAMWVWFFIVNYPIITVTHKNIDDLKVSYTLSEDGCYLTDINYDDYLKEASTIEIFFSKKIYLSEEGVLETNTAAQNNALIQAILDEQEGKGAVIYVDGKYKVQSLQLKSKTTIVIEEDCALIGPTYDDAIDSQAILWAKDAKNVNIYGPGTIVGNGETYTKDAKDPSIFTPLEEFNVKTRVIEARKRLREAKNKATAALAGYRPHEILLNNCSDCKIQSIRLYESAFWTLCVRDSNDITIKDVVIDNNVHVANADGIDIVSSQKVSISHCFISTSDDGICIKSSGNENCDDISIDRCSVMSMANSFKIGTETPNDVKDISVTNCYFFMPDNVVGGYAGIAIESADGANVEDIYVDNIYMNGLSSPLLIWLGDRLDKEKGSDGVTMGSMSKITVSNITAVNVEMSSAITGCVHNGETYYVSNVTLANFNVSYRNTGENLNVGPEDYEYSMNGYPEITRVLHLYLISHEASTYYDMPTYGLFARHVYGIEAYNINITPRSCNTLPRDNITQAKDRYDVIDVKVN